MCHLYVLAIQAAIRRPVPWHASHFSLPVPRHLLQILVLIQSLSCIVGDCFENNAEIL